MIRPGEVYTSNPPVDQWLGNVLYSQNKEIGSRRTLRIQSSKTKSIISHEY